MELILLERVDKLGSIGDIVSVRSGHARNFLLPQGKALVANAANKARFETEREAIMGRNAASCADSMVRSEAIEGTIYTVIRQSGDAGRLYGSVSARDVAAAAADIGHEIDWREVRIDRPIKDIGVHSVSLRLHPEVVTKVRVNVARSDDEAKRQAAGENVIEAELSGRAAERFRRPASEDQKESEVEAAAEESEEASEEASESLEEEDASAEGDDATDEADSGTAG